MNGQAADGLVSGDEPEAVVPLDYEQFTRQRRSELLRHVRRIADSPEQGEDALQEAMIEAYRRWPAVSVMEQPLGWVLRVTAHKLFLLRRGRRRPMTGALTGGGHGVVADPSEALVENSALWDAVRLLPPRLRQVVSIRHTFDLGVAEIAVLLDLKESTVRGHLARAYSQLRVLLDATSEDDAR